MASGGNFITDMQFEQHLDEMGDNQTELIKFVARQQYQMSKLCPIHSVKIKSLEDRNSKTFGIVGGIGAVLGAVIASTIDFFLRR